MAEGRSSSTTGSRSRGAEPRGSELRGPSLRGPELPGLDDLFDAARREGPAEQLRTLRDVLVRLPMLGAFNASLVHAQLPGAHYVATRAQWRRDFSREVRPGARPLVVLRPYAPVDFVFDVSQTDGRPLPDGILAPFRARGPVTAEGVAWFEGLLPRNGVAVANTEMGSAGAGEVQLLVPPDRYELASGRTVPQHRIVLVNAALDPAARLVTLFHELGHILCEHLPHPDDIAADRKQMRDLAGVGHRQREFEAECVAWLLCERLGIESPAGEYLHGYLEPDGSVPPISVHAVVRAVNAIESWARGLETLARRVAGDPAPVGGDEVHPQQGAFDFAALES